MSDPMIHELALRAHKAMEGDDSELMKLDAAVALKLVAARFREIDWSLRIGADAIRREVEDWDLLEKVVGGIELRRLVILALANLEFMEAPVLERRFRATPKPLVEKLYSLAADDGRDGFTFGSLDMGGGIRVDAGVLCPGHVVLEVRRGDEIMPGVYDRVLCGGRDWILASGECELDLFEADFRLLLEGTLPMEFVPAGGGFG